MYPDWADLFVGDYYKKVYDEANEQLPVSVFLNDKFWFSSYVNEKKVRNGPTFNQQAYYCRLEARVWCRITVDAPHRREQMHWNTHYVECSPRYDAAGDGRKDGGCILLPRSEFSRYYNCFGYFPSCFWERELLVATLNTLRDQYEPNHFIALCRSVGF